MSTFNDHPSGIFIVSMPAKPGARRRVKTHVSVKTIVNAIFAGEGTDQRYDGAYPCVFGRLTYLDAVAGELDLTETVKLAYSNFIVRSVNLANGVDPALPLADQIAVFAPDRFRSWLGSGPATPAYRALRTEAGKQLTAEIKQFLDNNGVTYV